MNRIFTIALLATVIMGCTPEKVSPVADPYVFTTPSNFPKASYTFENNPVTKDGFELGRALFYDPVLSSDSSIACANCHQQVTAFADPVHRFSKGVGDVNGVRNAPAIQNMAFQTHFFWDGGANHLDFVPINAITSNIEMAEKLVNVLKKLERGKTYPEKFNAAFGSKEVTSQKMLYALSQFMCMLVSSNSRYDKYVRGEGEILTSQELNGLSLFSQKCSSCHATDLFTDGSFRNNGLDASFALDSGRQRITEISGDRGKFKVPSLRNADVTKRYMHDGRFNTLKEVLDHYGSNVIVSETLDPILNSNGVKGISLSEQQKLDIISFIKTLTDTEYTHDKRFSNPFLK
ncbi:MAG: cytochrome-c peroxidase [Cyclobacteriaceae bacterium]|nr:cytochrome-c peroxidase [Cyclobacteriaceae bacterium]